MAEPCSVRLTWCPFRRSALTLILLGPSTGPLNNISSSVLLLHPAMPKEETHLRIGGLALLKLWSASDFIILTMRVCAPHMPDFPGEWAVPSGWIGLSRSSRSSCYIGRVLLPMWLPAYLPKFPVARWPLARWIGLSGPSKSSVV